MSATEILIELPRLTSFERRIIRERLSELDERGEPFKNAPPKTSRVVDFIRVWQSSPADSAFADDLETVNRADQPLANPWD